MPQTTVDDTLPIAVAGQLANLHTEQDGKVGDATSEETSAEVPFGVMVCRGTAEDGVKLLNTSAAAMAAKLRGVVVFAHIFAKPDELGDTGLKPNVTFGVLEEGEIYVFPEDAVTPDSEVHVRAVATGNEVKGAFRGTADGTDTVDITPLAKWVKGGDSTTPAVLWIDMSNGALATADS